MKDFKMLEKEVPDINLFGVDATRPGSKVGAITDVGPSKYLDHLDNQRMGIGKIIGDRGALDLLSTLGLQKDGRSIVADLSNINDLIMPDALLGKRTFTLFQNTVDIHGGTAKVMDNKYIMDLSRHGDIPAGMEQKYADGTNLDFTNASLFNKFGKDSPNSILERDITITDIALRTIKGMNILGADVYQDGMSRAPEPFEIASNYYNLKSLFSDPTYYMVSKLHDQYAMTRNTKMIHELVDYFYQPKARKVVDIGRIEDFISDMKKGKIRPPVYNKLSFSEFKNPARQFKLGNFDMFDVVPQGKELREVVQKDIFRDPEAMPGVDRKLHTKLGSVVQDALDRITFLEASGKRIEEIADEFFWDDNVPDFVKPNATEVPGAIGRGAIRTALNTMYSRLSAQASHFNKPNTKYDDGKFGRMQFKMKNIESAIAILDAQYAKGLIGEGSQHAVFKDYNPKQRFVKAASDIYVLSYKGNQDAIKNLIKDNQLDLSMFNREGWFKEGKTYKTLPGNTYIEIKNPIMHERVSEQQKQYSKALRDITDQAQLENVFSGDDVAQIEFIDKVLQTRRDISDNFSGAINNSKSKPLSKRVWEMNDAKEKSILDRYFRLNSEKLLDYNPEMTEEMAIDWLAKYLIKPQPLMSKYTSIQSDGAKVDLPYYSINNRLVSSTYKYLKSRDMLPIVENIVRAQEKHVRNEWTEADDFIESNYNMYQDGYNWGNLEANYVKSLTGPGFYSPFWKAYKGSKGFDYTDPQVLNSFDNAKIGINRKAPKDVPGCK